MNGKTALVRHRFPPEIIQRAIWLYLRFTLSYRDVEELLAERGLPACPVATGFPGVRANPYHYHHDNLLH